LIYLWISFITLHFSISIAKNSKSWADNRPSILVHFLPSFFYSSNKGIAKSYCIQIASRKLLTPIWLHEKNSFAKVSKNLPRYRSENIFVINHWNNYVRSIDDNAVKNFNILVTSSSVLHNYFDSLNKITFRYVFQQNRCFHVVALPFTSLSVPF